MTVETAINSYHQAYLACIGKHGGSGWRGLGDQLETRRACIRKYGFAIPNEEALAAICKLSPIVEVGAGTGYWAMLLRERGCDVLAFDNAVPETGKADQNEYGFNGTWTEVLHGDEQIAAKYPRRTLMLCWPPYNTPMAAATLDAYQGRTLVYIGEGEGGCNASDEFFEELRDYWTEVATIDIPQWFGINDYLAIYQRI